MCIRDRTRASTPRAGSACRRISGRRDCASRGHLRVGAYSSARRRLHLSPAPGLGAARLVQSGVAQPQEPTGGREGRRVCERAVPLLAMGVSSAPMISMTQIGPRYGRRNSLRSPSLGGAMSTSKHAALPSSRNTRPDSCIFPWLCVRLGGVRSVRGVGSAGEQAASEAVARREFV